MEENSTRDVPSSDGPDDDDDDDATSASLAALAGGAGGSAVGAAGAALLIGEGSTAAVAAGAVGPAGVPLAGSVAGPAGVPLAGGVGTGSTGVPFSPSAVGGPGGVAIGGSGASGATGVPMSTAGATGPVGVSITTPIKIARRGRLIGLVSAGAAAVAVVAVVVAVKAGDNDPIVSGTVVPAESGVVVTTGATSTESTVGLVTTTSAPLVAALVGPACTVGTWVADNDTFGSRFQEVAGGPVSSVSVTGEVRVDIAADGAVLTTFTDFRLVAQMPGAGPAEMSESGSESSTITFAEDGSYTVTDIQIGSTQVLSSNGSVIMENASPQAAFEAASTYTCDGDELVMTIPGDPSDFIVIFHRSG